MTLPRFTPLSESSITLSWGNTLDETIHQQITHFHHLLNQHPFTGFVESVPAYTTLTIYYQPESILRDASSSLVLIKKHLETLTRLPTAEFSSDDHAVSIPVCYEEDFGYDLDFVAQTHGLSKETVVNRHQEQPYKVYMMGFLPGFAYMGPVDDAIASPRKETPRANVEAGSVGIAGIQTGIYPLKSPGGWQIIGRTPLCLFDPKKANPFLLKTGDTVQFYAITKEDFYRTQQSQAEISPIQQGDLSVDALVIKPGVYATIQDLGRVGFRAYGVPVGGAMDTVAHQIANALVGNSAKAASIECAMGGLVLQFKQDTKIAVTGGSAAFINQKNVSLYACHTIAKNDVLELRYNHQGLRSYLAVKGGFFATTIMKSKSACPMLGIGSPLKKGSALHFDQDYASDNPKITGKFTLPDYTHHKTIRVMQGPEEHWMTADSLVAFYNQKFTLGHRCDRMGYHLQSEPLFLTEARELLSTAVSKGTIQLTPNGQLILLMSDCQTTGGYPRIGQVAAVDLPLLAQLAPGDSLDFKTISFAEAETLFLGQQKSVHELFD